MSSNLAQTATTVHLMYNSRVNLISQLNSAGFDTKNYASFNIHQINAMYTTGQMDFMVEKSSPVPQKTYIRYHLIGPLRSGTLNAYVDKYYGNGLDENTESVILDKQTDALIILSENEPNESLRDSMALIYEKRGVYVNVINVKRLQYNVLDHELCPKMEVISQNDMETIKTKLNISNFRQLPEISRYDPMAMAFMLRPGNIAKFHRKSPTAQTTDYYRICI
jgi:DNA-directed RNA polymerase subunit H (RpoH/RPB5)